MKKLALNLAICVGACAVLGAVCLFGGCAHEATDDDVPDFVTGIQNTKNYEGSFTVESTNTYSASYSDSDDSEDGETTTSAKATYDAESGNVAVKGSEGDEAYNMYFTKSGDDINGYEEDDDTKSVISSYLASTYYKIYSKLSNCVSLASVSDDGTIDDVKYYMMETVDSSFAELYKSATLKVSGSTYTLTYSADEAVEDLSATGSTKITFKFSSNGLTEISWDEDASLGLGSLSLGGKISGKISIKYSYTSSMMPSSFDGWGDED